eukprot:TRINITY_DN19393_c0_g1_i1.p1 TRINITY_DN19393_c0_g1~~TRINITY_DN19393_c0_g1_i1.p1  ORF type:complete len:252 (+),score=24.45 TRINITY_DN19393_c0_g1_i1:52-756(+)
MNNKTTHKLCTVLTVVLPALGLVLCALAMGLPSGIGKRGGGDIPNEIKAAANSMAVSVRIIWDNCEVFDCPILEECDESHKILTAARVFTVMTWVGFLFCCCFAIIMTVKSQLFGSSRPYLCIQIVTLVFSIIAAVMFLVLYRSSFCSGMVLADHHDFGATIPLMFVCSFMAFVLVVSSCFHYNRALPEPDLVPPKEEVPPGNQYAVPPTNPLDDYYDQSYAYDDDSFGRSRSY